MKKNFNIKNTKLIIWDLDETFWDGTLTESDVKFKPEITKFIEELVTKGIMNSICSKNDYDKVKTTFVDNDYEKIWNYFLFPSIDWTPKGQRVKNIIELMNLREENVIFIDDSELNLNEAKFYCPKLMTATSEQISILLKDLYMVNDYDFDHTRLQQYKILEQKEEDKLSLNCSNEDFLRNSKILISINTDCENHIDRIAKLIGRTNQLNFTKSRSTKEELEKYFADPNYENAYIVVKDSYGSYGICGFYTLDKKENKLINFLFSCRIMSMGVEQFVYSNLNDPELVVVGETASNIEKGEKIDWITQVEKLNIETTKPKKINNDINILFKGPCDLLSAIDYIGGDCNIDTEFPYWSKKLLYIIDHTHLAYIEQTNKMSQEELLKLTKKFPFPKIEDFQSNMFKKKYNLIFLSLLNSTHLGLYVNKKDGSYIVFGYSNRDMTDENNWAKMVETLPPIAQEQNLMMLRQFREEYTFAGNPPVEYIIKNLKYIRESLPSDTELIITEGSEIESDNTQPGYEEMAPRHVLVNRAVEEFAKDYDNIKLVNITKYIKDQSDFTVCINHFSRRVYLEMAKDFVKLANEALGAEHLTITQL